MQASPAPGAGLEVSGRGSVGRLLDVVLGLVPAAVRGELSGLGGGALLACGALAAAGLGGLVLQIAGQRTVGPARTSLLLMLEPVLAAVGGYLIGERLAPLGFVGAARLRRPTCAQRCAKCALHCLRRTLRCRWRATSSTRTR